MLRKVFALGLSLSLLIGLGAVNATVAAAADLPADQGWLTAGGGPQRNSVTPDSLKPSLYQRWRLPLGDDALATPVVAGGKVYAVTYSGTVYAADAADGTALWNYRPGVAGLSSVYGLTYSDGMLYMAGFSDQGGVLIALNVAGSSPAVAWQTPLPDWARAAPLVVDGVVVIGANNGTLVAVDARTGAEKWRQTLQGDFWRANQAVAGGTVVALSYSGRVYAYDMSSGALRWSDSLGGTFDPGVSPVIVGGTVYVASSKDWAGKVAAYDLLSGKRLWAYMSDRQDNRWTTPVVEAGHVLAPLQGSLYVLDAATGQPTVAPIDLPVAHGVGKKPYPPNLTTPLAGADRLWLPATFEQAVAPQLYVLDLNGGVPVGSSLRSSPLPATLSSGLAYQSGVLYFTAGGYGNDALYAMSALTLTAGGQEVAFPDVPAYLSPQGRFMVPLRFVLEATDATVEWVQETHAVIVRRGSTVIEMHQGSADVVVNGQPKTMDTPVTTVGDRTVVPLRFIAEWLGGQISWDQATLTAELQLPQ